MTLTDLDHMRHAIDLARLQVGQTGDNPAVGCVIVLNGHGVGEGATGQGGRPHAEELALDQAGDRARGATAFVTLEPCGERSAGGSSCSERLIAAGIARIVVSSQDASHLAAGRGLERLRAAGLEVELGLASAEADQLYLDYRPAKK